MTETESLGRRYQELESLVSSGQLIRARSSRHDDEWKYGICLDFHPEKNMISSYFEWGVVIGYDCDYHEIEPVNSVDDIPDVPIGPTAHSQHRNSFKALVRSMEGRIAEGKSLFSY
tara:strand:- start:70 stop:417 length:348 start_codon:yes stop_codon:yes gene_type:complete